MNVDMIPATIEHAIHIARHARREDVLELWAAGRTDPLSAMRKGMFNSTGRALTGMIAGEPVCMWGIAEGSLLGNVGVPWMIGSARLDAHAMTFLRRCASQLDQLAAGYELLSNWIDARNTKAIRWLRWLGFTVEAAEEYGFDRKPFHPFWKNCHV